MGGQIQKTTLITIYSAGVAACYLAGFWSRFDVDIFQFAGLTGFASMALYPMMTAVGLNLLGVMLLNSDSTKRPAQEANKESIWRSLFKKVQPVWFTLAPFGAFFLIFFVFVPDKWLLLLFVMFPWIGWLANAPLTIQFIPNNSFRLRIVYWLIALPLLATFVGSSNAQSFFDGNEKRTVAPTGAAKDLPGDEQHPVMYLGFAGGTYFLFESKTGNVVMISQAVAAPLTIQSKSSKPMPVTIPHWLRAIVPA
ncbi:hypothetical protein SAMN05444172_8203 [Burkholderia sp. GAS332]|nr:hypothetical protein SAMN05444172_8203 [Burkholderia sp. GAS332]